MGIHYSYTIQRIALRDADRVKKIGGSKTEREIHKTIAEILDRLGLIWCHVPNEGVRTWKTAALLKSLGMKKGVPDVLIFSPPPIGGFGAAIEVKTTRGRLSEEQREWLNMLSAIGWKTLVARSVDDVRNFLAEIGYLEKRS